MKTFAKGSLVIPMDVCYQCTRQSADGLDTATASCAKTGWSSAPSGNACPQKLAQGDVLKAYGLVYELIRNDVPVYWVIDPAKQAVDAYDLAIQYNAGFPVAKLDWASGQPGAPPTADRHRSATWAAPSWWTAPTPPRPWRSCRPTPATFSAVNVHVSNVAFQAPVAKTMAGGWSAGGTVPPKLALLNIASGNLYKRGSQALCTGSTDTSHACNTTYCLSDPKNAEPVIEGYLAKAGIGSGAAGGTATGTHGTIYDRLGVDDFIPSTPGDWTTTNFYRNGYQVLWVPHWLAPGSCRAPASSSGGVSACACLATRILDGATCADRVTACTAASGCPGGLPCPASEIDAVLQTIGSFNRAGNDVFAECAGLGSFEGAFNGLTATSYTTDYSDGDATTRFQSKTGVRYNQLPNNPFPAANLEPDLVKNYASPLMQIGDFPFKPYGGAIEDFKPDHTANADRNYQPGVTRLIGTKYTSGSPSVSRDWDYFTLRPPDTSAATRHGAIVYLAGHSYSGVQGSYQAAGSRLVVNTLFNLGAACTSSGVACATDYPGVCGRGVLTCDANGQQVCAPTVLPGSRPEACNGLDDDCDGLVDENLEEGCYDGPSGHPERRRLPRRGAGPASRTPTGATASRPATGEVVPAAEVCNGIDDDCNGAVDDQAGGGKLTEACYSGPPATLGVGTCRAGSRTCDSGSWGVCLDEVTPLADPCSAAEANQTGADRNCDHELDACGACLAGTTRPCYDGPTGTDGVGLCHHGTQTCNAARPVGHPVRGPGGPAGRRSATTASTRAATATSPRRAAATTARPTATPAAPATRRWPAGPGRPRCPAAAARWPSSSRTPRRPASASGATSSAPTASWAAACARPCQGRSSATARTTTATASWTTGRSAGRASPARTGSASTRPAPRRSPARSATTASPATASSPPAAPARWSARPASPAMPRPGAASTPAPGSPAAPAPSAPAASAPAAPATPPAARTAGCAARGAAWPTPAAGSSARAAPSAAHGDCVQSCAFRGCGGGQTCSADGFCVDDPCAGKACGATQTCVDGACVTDLCLGLACGAGQRCSEGACVDDPCTGVACPVGQCRDGQCYAVALPSALTGAGTTSSTSCGCSGGEGSPLTFLLLLLALPLARRRRPRGGAALGLALLAVAGTATGCKKTVTFDPAACAALASPARRLRGGGAVRRRPDRPVATAASAGAPARPATAAWTGSAAR